jgi:hypothetical protein
MYIICRVSREDLTIAISPEIVEINHDFDFFLNISQGQELQIFHVLIYFNVL